MPLFCVCVCVADGDSDTDSVPHLSRADMDRLLLDPAGYINLSIYIHHLLLCYTIADLSSNVC